MFRRGRLGGIRWVWRLMFLWRAGLPRVGLRSGPVRALRFSWWRVAAVFRAAAQPNAGQARSPREWGGWRVVFRRGRLGGIRWVWRLMFLWRAGLPRVGLRSGPVRALRFSWWSVVAVLGLLRSPTRGKPARHGSGAAGGVVFRRGKLGGIRWVWRPWLGESDG